MALTHIIGAAALFIIVCIISPLAWAIDSDAIEFARQAKFNHELELQSCQLALKRSHNKDVRKFADQIVEGHTKITEDMEAAFKAADIDPFMLVQNLDDEHVRVLEDLILASKSGFDTSFIDLQTDIQDYAVDIYKEYKNEGKNPALQAFVSETLPTLEHRQKAVNALQTRAGKDQKLENLTGK